MPPVSEGLHTLVLYRASAHADEVLRALCLAARERGSRVTVLALAPQERSSSRCCDIRSVLWNEICRDLARENLTRAAQALEGQAEAEFDVLAAPGRGLVAALTAEAVTRGADEIVLADPRASGLGRRERRRLRRRSPVPVSA
jgi:hypothetical protein